jgi:DNA-binding FadR family transcriptional regulator
VPDNDLHDAVLNKLGESIVVSEIGPGTVLRIEELERTYGVSRSVIREVLRTLASMNLVVTRRRVGVTIVEAAKWNVFDPRLIGWRLAGSGRLSQLRSLSELRSAIEPVAAALAADRAGPEHCSALTSAVMGMSWTGRAGERDAYLQHDTDFHRTLLRASGNEMFASLADVVVAVLAGRTSHHLMPERPNPEAIRLHMEVVDAIQSRDAGRARQRMADIVIEAEHAMMEVLDGTDTTAPAG